MGQTIEMLFMVDYINI